MGGGNSILFSFLFFRPFFLFDPRAKKEIFVSFVFVVVVLFCLFFSLDTERAREEYIYGSLLERVKKLETLPLLVVQGQTRRRKKATKVPSSSIEKEEEEEEA